MELTTLREALGPITAVLGSLDLADPARAAATLTAEFPLDSPIVQRIRELAEAGQADGTLLPKEAGGVRYGRVGKDCDGFSVDAVWMNGPGPKHRHPRGEINLLFRQEGEPTFEGHPEGWAVFAPDSVHVPTVAGGAMLILYFLPGGAVEWIR